MGGLMGTGLMPGHGDIALICSFWSDIKTDYTQTVYPNLPCLIHLCLFCLLYRVQLKPHRITHPVSSQWLILLHWLLVAILKAFSWEIKLHQATSFLARDLFSALVGATGLPQWNFNNLQASISRKGARYIPPMFAVSCLPSWSCYKLVCGKECQLDLC